MRHWLMKTEPTSFGLEQLRRAPRRTTAWDGVRNYQARNLLRAMQRGDRAFLYHSGCEVPGIIAIMAVVREAYPDPSAFDRRGAHYDPGSDPAQPRWFMVDVRLERALKRTIALAELRAHGARALKGMVLLRPGNRLSVSEVTAAHWKFILALE